MRNGNTFESCLVALAWIAGATRNEMDVFLSVGSCTGFSKVERGALRGFVVVIMERRVMGVRSCVCLLWAEAMSDRCKIASGGRSALK